MPNYLCTAVRQKCYLKTVSRLLPFNLPGRSFTVRVSGCNRTPHICSGGGGNFHPYAPLVLSLLRFRDKRVSGHRPACLVVSRRVSRNQPLQGLSLLAHPLPPSKTAFWCSHHWLIVHDFIYLFSYGLHVRQSSGQGAYQRFSDFLSFTSKCFVRL